MARNVSTKSKIALEFELENQDQETLSNAAGVDGLIPFLRSCAEAYFHEYSQGGLLLAGSDVAAISRAAEKDVTSSEDVIQLVEKGQKKSRGQSTFQVSIDPSLVDSFKQNADFMGCSVDEYIQSIWNHVMANGWLTQVMPDVFWVPLNGKDLKDIKKATKAEIVTSQDVVDAVRKVAA